MDSTSIAKEIESRHPSPPLHVDDPNVSLIATDLLPKASQTLVPIYVPSVPSQLLNPPSAAYFRRTREVRFSSTLEALRDDPDKGGGKAFELMAPHLEKVAELYRKNQEGPFLEGKEVRYADLVVVAWMKMFDRLGRLEEVLAAQEKVGEGKELRGLWEASQRWLERDDR